MKFFDKFKKKEEKSDVKSIFTDIDGNSKPQSHFDRFEQYKNNPSPEEGILHEEKIKYKTYDPYGDDAPQDIPSEAEGNVITDDVINSVLNSITEEDAGNDVEDTPVDEYANEPEVINIDEDGEMDTPEDDIDESVADEVYEQTQSEDTTEDAIDITEEIVEEEIDEEDKGIYDNLFTETTIVGTQIYTYDIDKQLNGYNYVSDINYRVGTEHSSIGSIFTITKKKLISPISVNRSHTDDEVNYYNDLAGLGYSYAAIRGTKVEGIVLCEPQYWNNTLAIRYITVTEPSRKQGIARQMLLKVIETAQHAGFRGIYAEVGSKNGSAVEFFLHNHFHITGTNTILYSNSDILKNQVGIFLYRAIV